MKKLIIGCAIIVCVLLCIIFVISSNQSKKVNLSDATDSSNEAVIEVDGEESEEVTLTITNTTGKTIDEIYFYGDEVDENGNLIGNCVLDEALLDGESIEVAVGNYDENTQWDITAMIDGVELEMDYTVGSDFVYDGSVIIFGLQDNKLVILDEELEEVEEVEAEEEEVEEEPTEEQTEVEEENVMETE